MRAPGPSRSPRPLPSRTHVRTGRLHRLSDCTVWNNGSSAIIFKRCREAQNGVFPFFLEHTCTAENETRSASRCLVQGTVQRRASHGPEPKGDISVELTHDPTSSPVVRSGEPEEEKGPGRGFPRPLPRKGRARRSSGNSVEMTFSLRSDFCVVARKPPWQRTGRALMARSGFPLP